MMGNGWVVYLRAVSRVLGIGWFAWWGDIFGRVGDGSSGC